MQIVPLSPVPAQTLGSILNGQNCDVTVYSENTGIFLDLTLNGEVIATSRVLLDAARVLQDCQYKKFVGDFIMVDTQGELDPVYTGLGSRWILVYLSAEDLVIYGGF